MIYYLNIHLMIRRNDCNNHDKLKLFAQNHHYFFKQTQHHPKHRHSYQLRSTK